MSRARPILVLLGLVLSGPLVVFVLSQLKPPAPPPSAPVDRKLETVAPRFPPAGRNPGGFFPGNPRDTTPSEVLQIEWGEMWGAGEPDPAVAKKLFDGRQLFLANDRACLAAAMAGTGFGG